MRREVPTNTRLTAQGPRLDHLDDSWKCNDHYYTVDNS